MSINTIVSSTSDVIIIISLLQYCCAAIIYRFNIPRFEVHAAVFVVYIYLACRNEGEIVYRRYHALPADLWPCWYWQVTAVLLMPGQLVESSAKGGGKKSMFDVHDANDLQSSLRTMYLC